MPEKKTLNEDLFYKGSSANLPRLHMCENKIPSWDFKEFAVTEESNPVTKKKKQLYNTSFSTKETIILTKDQEVYSLSQLLAELSEMFTA